MSDLALAGFEVTTGLHIGVERDHHIDVERATQMTTRFRKQAGPGAVKGLMTDRAIIDEILAQPGCAGIRMYFALEADNSPTLVVVGVDANGLDLYHGVMAEDHYPCPPFCDGNGSPLKG